MQAVMFAYCIHYNITHGIQVAQWDIPENTLLTHVLLYTNEFILCVYPNLCIKTHINLHTLLGTSIVTCQLYEYELSEDKLSSLNTRPRLTLWVGIHGCVFLNSVIGRYENSIERINKVFTQLLMLNWNTSFLFIVNSILYCMNNKTPDCKIANCNQLGYFVSSVSLKTGRFTHLFFILLLLIFVCVTILNY